MKLTLDQTTIQRMDLFHTLTGSSVVDCVAEDDYIYFVVTKGQYGLAVGKNGIKIKNAERVFKKPIKVFEFSDDLDEFIRNLVPDVQEISKSDRLIFIKVDPKNRAKVIGKSGKNIKIINKLLQRLFDVDEMKIK